MKNIFKKLWYDYLVDECGKMDTEEEKRIAAELLAADQELRATLSEEQKLLFEKTQKLVDDTYAVFAEKAFEKGLSFSFEYLLALWGRE